jgi:DNA polymerase-3 subunit alpha
MFDLWGKTMPAPLPSLDMDAVNVSIRERLVWEKELLGVYLSEHPFSPFAQKVGSENTTLCGHIDAEMEGQTVRVAGIVASLRKLFITRDGQPSLSTVLEDLDGRVGVMVWPKVYTSTKELWQEGNILLVEGKVKVRGDRVQLNCDRVRRYPLEPVQSEGVAPSQSNEASPVAEETKAKPVPAQSRRLIISINQTSDEVGDIAQLHKLIDTLRQFPGQNEVNLCVANDERVFRLKQANVTTNYCLELHKRLVELLGEDGVRLEESA